MTGVLLRSERFEDAEETHGEEEGHLTMEAEIGVTDGATSQGVPRVAGNLQKLEEAREEP